MACNHERLVCTDNVLVCKLCGAVLPLSVLGGETPAENKNAAEAPKKAVKRKAKKEAE